MGPFPRLCVADASVLIDLNNGGVLYFFFSVIDERGSPEHTYA